MTTLAVGDALADQCPLDAPAALPDFLNRLFLVLKRYQVTASVCAGFDYVGGTAVSSALDLPAGVRPFTTIDMYNGN